VHLSVDAAEGVTAVGHRRRVHRHPGTRDLRPRELLQSWPVLCLARGCHWLAGQASWMHVVSVADAYEASRPLSDMLLNEPDCQ